MNIGIKLDGGDMLTVSGHTLPVYVNSVREYSYVTNRAPFAGKERSSVGSRPRYRASGPKE